MTASSFTSTPDANQSAVTQLTTSKTALPPTSRRLPQSYVTLNVAHTADAQPTLGNTSTLQDVNRPYRNPRQPMHILGMRKWEGRVIEIGDDLLTAELVPLDHDGPILRADFDIDLLDMEDFQFE